MTETADRAETLRRAEESFRQDSESNRRQAAWYFLGGMATTTAMVFTPEVPITTPVFERGIYGLEASVIFGTFLLSSIKTLRARRMDAAGEQMREEADDIAVESQ